MKKISFILDYGIELSFYVSLFFWIQFPKYPIYFQTIGVFYAIFFWVLKSIENKHLVYKHFPWNIWILLLNLWIWFSLFWSVNRSQSFFYNLVFTAGSIFMILLSSCIYRKIQISRILSFFFIICAYFSLNAILPNLSDFIHFFRTQSSLVNKLLFQNLQFNRIKSSMGEANSVGGLYAVIMSLLFPLLIFGFRSDLLKGKIRFHFWVFLWKFIIQIIGWILFGLFMLTLLMSASQGAMLGLFFAFLLVFFMQNRFITNLNFLLLLFTGCLIPSIQFFLTIIYAGVVDESRYVIWQNSIELVKMVPYTGIGLGNFAKAYLYYFHENVIHAHNIFLNTAVELGIPGLILFTLLGGSFVYFGILYSLEKRGKDPFFYSLNLGLTALVFGFLVRCLVDYTI